MYIKLDQLTFYQVNKIAADLGLSQDNYDFTAHYDKDTQLYNMNIFYGEDDVVGVIVLDKNTYMLFMRTQGKIEKFKYTTFRQQDFEKIGIF